GIFHMEIPNFLSYFEGHYLVVQPPIVWKWVLPAWICLIGRDPAFARTLNTYINPNWCRYIARRMAKRYDITLVSIGEEVFLDRLAKDFTFETRAVSGKLAVMISVIRALNVRNWIGHAIVGMRGYYPIYFTMRKN